MIRCSQDNLITIIFLPLLWAPFQYKGFKCSEGDGTGRVAGGGGGRRMTRKGWHAGRAGGDSWYCVICTRFHDNNYISVSLHYKPGNE